MVDWIRIKRELQSVIEMLTESLTKPQAGFTLPQWDASQIADEVVSETQTASVNAGSNCNEYATALAITAHKMARVLDWYNIHRILVKEIRNKHRNNPQIQNNVEDIVLEATKQAARNWNFIQEVDWSRPGFSLAKYYADKLITKEIKRKKSITASSLSNNEEQDILAAVPSNAPGPAKLASAVKPDKLTTAIEDWLYKNCLPKVAAAWILYEVWGVPWQFCYIVSCESKWWKIILQKICGFFGISVTNPATWNSDAFRKKWERICKEINDELSEFLKKNQSMYM